MTIYVAPPAPPPAVGLDVVLDIVLGAMLLMVHLELPSRVLIGISRRLK